MMHGRVVPQGCVSLLLVFGVRPMRNTSNAFRPLAFFTRRAWIPAFVLLVPIIISSVLCFFCCLDESVSRKESKANCWCVSYIFAAFAALISLVFTMCAGLVGVITGLAVYIFVIIFMIAVDYVFCRSCQCRCWYKLCCWGLYFAIWWSGFLCIIIVWDARP